MVDSKKAIVLRVPIAALKLVAMWPLDTANIVIIFLRRIYLILSATCLGVCSLGLLLKTITTNDLVNRSEAIDIFTLTLSAMYKQLFFVRHYNQFHYLVINADKLDIPVEWMKYSPMLAAAHCCGGFTAIGFWWSCPIWKVIFGVTSLKEMPLPINVDFIYTFTGWKFAVIFSFCCTGIILATQVYMAVDGFLFTSVYAANGALQKLSQRLTDLRNQETDQREINELKDCVKTHCFIIDFLINVDTLFRSLILVDVFHAIISLSFAMLQMSESKGALEWIKMIIFVSYCFLHQYLNSYFGQALINKQEDFRLALEEIPWVENIKLGKATQIITTMASKPVKLSAWRMYFLQYATFTEFVKNMISTYMVLRQLQDQSH